MITLNEFRQLERRLENHKSVTLMKLTENETKAHIKVRCRQCQSFTLMVVETRDLYNWAMNIALIQDVWPELTADEREAMISGMCGKCFDALFARPEEK